MKRFFEYGEQEIAHLKKRDKKLGAYIEKVGIIKREVTPDLFTALVRSIIGQQISGKAAESVFNRLAKLTQITPEAIISLSIDEIRSCGTSIRKSEYLKNTAEAFVAGRFGAERIDAMSDAEIVMELTSIKGVGIWTAEMLLIFSLERKDVVSRGDLAIRRGMMRLYGISDLSKEKFDMLRERYSPYGTIASFYLWHIS